MVIMKGVCVIAVLNKSVKKKIKYMKVIFYY